MVTHQMPFRRGRLGMNPINRTKHVVDSQFGTTLGTVVNTVLVQSVDATALADTDGCLVGATVNGIYLNVEVVSTSETGVLQNAYLMVAKNPGGNLTFPVPNAVGADDNKRYVIHQEMIMLDSEATTHIPRTIFKGVIVIPKHLRRVGPADNIFVAVLTPGGTANWCLQAHYKEFR